MLDPVGLEFPTAAGISVLVREAVRRVQPDLIWSEHVEPAAGVAGLALQVPWVYSHHDWLYRLRRIRHGAPRLRDRWWLIVCRRAERTVIQAASWVVTGSFSDARRIEHVREGGVRVIPVAYAATAPFSLDKEAFTDVRIVHLGSLETTANRIGLEHYLRTTHASVMAQCRNQGIEPSLWIVGDASRMKEPLRRALREARTMLTGFVSDLTTVLRPFDISILPYEHDSGYRTKLPLLFKYAQVVVTTRSAIQGSLMPGLDEVCLVCDRLDDFPAAITSVAANPERREQLGKAAYTFFKRHFTHEAVGRQYRGLIDQVASLPHKVEPR